MGVDIGAASWPYGGFHRFRTELASLEQIDLQDMRGYRPGGRSWDEVDTALRPLLDHSDCDGELAPAECEAMIPRFAELVDALSDAYDREHAAALLEEFRWSVATGQHLQFR